MTRITSQDVLKVAKLARLELAVEEVELYTSQLEKILGYIEELEKVETTNVPPTTRAVEVVNVVREDFVVKTQIREELLEQAPNREGNFYRVPKILS